MSIHFRFDYQLVAYLGQEINVSEKPLFTINASVPPIVVNPEHFGEDGASKVYTMAVRLRTQKVRKTTW